MEGQHAIAATRQSFALHAWSGSGPDYLHIHHADDEVWHILVCYPIWESVVSCGKSVSLELAISTGGTEYLVVFVYLQRIVFGIVD